MKSLRTKAQGWVYFLYDHYFQEDANNNLTDFIQYFKVEGFANEPEVYIKTTNEGLEFGYIATRWDGYMVLLPSGVFCKRKPDKNAKEIRELCQPNFYDG